MNALYLCPSMAALQQHAATRARAEKEKKGFLLTQGLPADDR
jgi:hypothetical protein